MLTDVIFPDIINIVLMRSIRNGKVRYAAVAHLVERHLAKVEVASSSLVSRSKKRKHRLKVGAFCFIRRITPSPLRGHTRTFRHSCGLDAGGEIGPNPGTGDFRPGRAGAFCRLRRRENCCRAAAGVCKRGYRTPGLTSRFPIPPLATPPDLPVCCSAELRS